MSSSASPWTHAYDLVRRRTIPSLRLGRRIVIPRRALLTLLEVEAAQKLSASP